MQAVSASIATRLRGRCSGNVLRTGLRRSKDVTFWLDFLRTLNRRGLTGVKLVISDAHEGLKAAAAKVLGATWQRCRVHFMRSALAHAVSLR